MNLDDRFVNALLFSFLSLSLFPLFLFDFVWVKVEKGKGQRQNDVIAGLPNRIDDAVLPGRRRLYYNENGERMARPKIIPHPYRTRPSCDHVTDTWPTRRRRRLLWQRERNR